MASYRPFPPPNQPQIPPLAPLPQSRAANQYSQNWGAADASSFPQNYPNQTSFLQPPHYGDPPRHPIPLGAPPQPQQPYAYPPPPPPPESAYPPPPAGPAPPSLSLPPQPPVYYPSSQYSQFSNQPLQPLQPPPPPPPPSSPPSLAIPPPPQSSPPPPPASVPEVAHGKDSQVATDRGPKKDGSRESGSANQGASAKHHKPFVPPMPGRRSNGPLGRIETEEERRLRKKRESEKQRQEDKHRQHLKDSQNKILHKTQMISSGMKGLGSISGSHMGDKRSTPFLSAERTENRLKKPTTFICKLKFRNELPDPTEQPKLLSMKRDKDQIAKYRITSLEKLHKPQLYVEPDLGIPLDLLDLSVYNPPKGKHLYLDPEDEALLRDDDPVTPIKKDGIKRKERPTDEGVSWLVKTQYISPLSTEATKQSLTEKQAKELRERRGGRNILDNFNNRESKIQEIVASFEACKSRPVHATNKKLQPVEILPLFPDLDRDDDQFVIASFDSAPTADSEMYKKLENSDRDAFESQAIMKSFVVKDSESNKQDKFLAYMVPSLNELSKDMFDEHEDISFTWVREYHWDVRGEDVDDPTTYLVTFDESEARYVPLPTKLVLRKKRAREGKSSDEVEHFPAPAMVTVRRRSKVSTVELKEPRGYSDTRASASASKSQRVDNRSPSRQRKFMQDTDVDQSSGAEYDMSD